MRQATALGQVQDWSPDAAERHVLATPAGQLSACAQMACWPGSGSVSAAGRTDLTGSQDGRRAAVVTTRVGTRGLVAVPGRV